MAVLMAVLMLCSWLCYAWALRAQMSTLRLWDFETLSTLSTAIKIVSYFANVREPLQKCGLIMLVLPWALALIVYALFCISFIYCKRYATKILKVKPPAPFSIPLANKNNIKLGGNNQKLILLSLGNAMSGPPTIKGNKKLPNPPINPGMTIKNSWVGLVFLRRLPPCERCVIVSHHTALQLQFWVLLFSNIMLMNLYPGSIFFWVTLLLWGYYCVDQCDDLGTSFVW